MKHTEIKAFVRKYNNEISIKGYSKMRKADLAAAVNSALTRSRKELKQEWRQLNGHSTPAKPKTKPNEKKKIPKTTKKLTASERKYDEWHQPEEQGHLRWECTQPWYMSMYEPPRRLGGKLDALLALEAQLLAA